MVALRLVVVVLELVVVTSVTTWAPSSLDGYAYNCDDGTAFSLDGPSRVICFDPIAGDVDCGTYSYSGSSDSSSPSLLTFNLGGGVVLTTLDLLQKDGILISFTLSAGVAEAHCIVVSKNFREFATGTLGLECPIQNAIVDVTFERNHFSLGNSGHVALRSKLHFVSNGDSVNRDSFGVYTWWANGTIKFYFGGQQGREPFVAMGTLGADGLFIEGAVPPGPCVHDGESFLISPLDTLPVTEGAPNDDDTDTDKDKKDNCKQQEEKKATFTPRAKNPDKTKLCKFLKKGSPQVVAKRRRKFCKEGKDATEKCPKSCGLC